ncbi:MAG: vanadium-dependent haloperoxidase [Hyellaceae cyanobacterium CSU_1_1]|nr:vanadium-dependent haloperoxidase [Hyellaceae cyanobacterium CSU_1_1]
MNTDAILFWNNVALNAVANDHTGAAQKINQRGPTRTARALAIVHAAMFDAFNVIARAFTPYLKNLPPASGTASKEAAIAQAAFTTLVALYPGQTNTFYTELNNFLNTLPTGSPCNEGIAIGTDIGKRILAARNNDGSDAPMTYQPGGLPGLHDLDPLNPDQGFLTPRWGLVKPFVVPNIIDFRSPAPPELMSAAYADSFNDVKSNGAKNSTTRTPDQTEIGIFWAYDGAQKIGTPPRLYNQNIREVAMLQKNNLAQNARLFALANLAMADAGIQCWDTKYFYNIWRPILAVRNGQQDGNILTTGDPNFEPLGAPRPNEPGRINFTPNFPSYTSGHATFGAAVFWTLRRFYGKDDIPFTLSSDEFNGVNLGMDGKPRPKRQRSFKSFTEALQENARSRIYLGIHYQFDAYAGSDAGIKIANYVYGNILRPVN